MIIFNVVTLFPRIFDGFLNESFIKKARERGLVEIRIWDLRNFGIGKRKLVDDRPYGGGLGMVLRIEPIYRAIEEIKNRNSDSGDKKVVLFTPRGQQFTQKFAYSLLSCGNLILICGRYEGVDERVFKYVADFRISLGPFDLMGGEVPAMAMIETMCRLVPGVIGKERLLKERITKNGGFIEFAQYTRPPVFSPHNGVYWRVPKVLLSGDHRKIERWRKRHQKIIL